MITRRSILECSALFGATLMGAPRMLRAVAEQQQKDSIVQTTSGKVRGYRASDVTIFKGIPYGASTAGQNRFMPPKRQPPWLGIRDVLEYGPMAMQPAIFTSETFAAWAATDSGRLMKGLIRWPLSGVSEDCLVLNVWTRGLGDGKKRPVMVWLHGGGFASGSGDWGWTDGTNLARNDEVVVVSLNHRLNIFGFLYLDEIGGSKYTDSGNVGMLDIVAALEWVRDNILAFGGDPGNVTVFGQSGGGCKVAALMAMPSAQGLFHRAIDMSGPCPKVLSREEATRAATQVLDHLDIDCDHIELLQEVPAHKLLRAMNAVLAAANVESGDNTWTDGTWFHMFDPVVDGHALPQHPFYPAAPEMSAQVPMLIGNMGYEDRSSVLEMLTSPNGLNETQVRARLSKLGIENPHADQLIHGYRASRPDASLADVFTAIVSDLEFRMDAIAMAERKAAQSKVPAYMYLFTWESPAFGGKFKSPHSLDVPFVFDNIGLAPGIWGPKPDPRRYQLAKNVSKAWVAFARTGNPNHSGLPEWKPYTLHDRATMLLNYSCELVNDPRREDRLVMEQLRS